MAKPWNQPPEVASGHRQTAEKALDSQTLAAFGAACIDHGAATTGTHAVPEAVLLRTATVVGLVGALHAALLELHGAALTDRRTSFWTADLGGPTTTNAKTTVARPAVATEAAAAASGRPVTTPSRSLLACPTLAV